MTSHRPPRSRLVVDRLVLWDIDRTLVYVGSIDRLVYREVFTELVGREPASLRAVRALPETAPT